MAAPLALVDCNNFYASCERLFQPDLRGKPVVVLSNNDGCVIARSNEAKALGIPMGAPWHLYKEKFGHEARTNGRAGPVRVLRRTMNIGRLDGAPIVL